MSGIFGMLGGLMGGGEQGQGEQGQNAAGGLLAHVINAAGGPAGIAQKFEQSGLGAKAQSWIGQGHNLPVSPEEIAKVFPPEQIDAWAQQHGMPAGVASQVLAQFLPHAVDHATPDGSAPAADAPQPQVSQSGLAGMLSRLTEGS